MVTHKFFSLATQSWRFAEHLHTAIFIVGLRHDALARESVTFLESSAGQTGLLLAILGLLAFLHLRLTNMNRGRPIPHGQGTSDKNRQPKRARRTDAAKASRPRRSDRRTATTKPPRNRR